MNRNIQVLRALAAYGVVGHHVIDSLRNYIAIGVFTANPQVGATGVNIFFVISGFIMVLTTMDRSITPSEFIMNRIRRIVPIYWILTFVTIVALCAGLHIFNETTLGANRVIDSLFFLPNIAPDDVVVRPILFVGWTLNYEMMFYLIFAMFLFLPIKALRFWGIAAVLIGLWLVGTTGRSAYARYWGDDIVLAFLVGALLWPLARAYPMRSGLAFAAIPLALIGLALPDLLPGLNAMPHSGLVVTVAAGVLVFAGVSLEQAGHSVRSGWLTQQGDASYSLYLIHPFVLQLLGKLSMKTGLNTSVAGLVVTVVIMMVASGYAGLMFHRFVENPITQRLRRREARLRFAVS